MTLQIAFKQMDTSPGLKSYAEEQSKRLEEHLGSNFHITWNFQRDHFNRVVHCHLMGKKMNYFSESTTDNFILSIDEALEKIERQILKHKETIQKRRNKMKSIIGVPVLLILIMSAATGCSHKPPQPEQGNTSLRHELPSENIDLKMVHFNFNKSILTETAKTVLKRNALELKRDPSLSFQIQGYCDDRGGKKYNVALGERRAEAVKNYLIEVGVDSHRISIVSFGKSYPLMPEENEGAYAVNRRASFSLLSKEGADHVVTNRF